MFKFRLRALCGLGLLLILSGCAGSAFRQSRLDRPFVLGRDTFSFANELDWIYAFETNTTHFHHEKRVPPPTYSQHCFVVARAARQFFQNARFEPSLPRLEEREYRRLVRRLMAVSPRRVLSAEQKVTFPGYADLFSFSRDWERLLKHECGGAWQSYFQRGHWRMIFPFRAAHQARAAAEFCAALRENRAPIVHVLRFPQLSINHAILLMDYQETAREIRFGVYDPNFPARRAELIFNRDERRFYFPPIEYFRGGRVNAYQVYYSWRY